MCWSMRSAERPGVIRTGRFLRTIAGTRRWGPWGIALVGFIPGHLAGAQFGSDDRDRLQLLQEMIKSIAADYPDVATVTPAALRGLLETGTVVLVDVREPEERAVSTLPGAIDMAAFETRTSEWRAGGLTVVAYCTVGLRSSAYARRMGARGIRVHNLEGGILAWSHAGYTFRAGASPTRRLHVYGRRWNLAAKGYEATW